MIAMTYGPTRCPFGLVLKSKLLHIPKAHHGFLLKLSHHGGKNNGLFQT